MVLVVEVKKVGSSPITQTAKNRPVIEKDLEPGIMAEANKDGSTFVAKGASPAQKKSAVAHEEIHHEQMERGDLSYTDNEVVWKGKKYSRAQMSEGAKTLPWEREAYKRS